ncbi:hypothetical protein [Streptomyces neyagawaensis]|uniref:hypothetical protein n=1 Tax=Streptomyces neyagawaensis TaxID=42238 RepID=UPI00201D259F|nr:hypothetical protein [Streptomyces neyagawaensis]MCL6731827.1 hypothetical protein [Streptomyces neyagawaensis]MDE1683383.1 hypothetical protein [Streptomyces neyagawaensis]
MGRLQIVCGWSRSSPHPWEWAPAPKALSEPQGRERVKLVEREDMLRESDA